MDSYIDVNRALANAETLLKQRKTLFDQIDIVRTDLRNAVTMNGTTAEQTAKIREMFPKRKRTTKTKA